MPPKATPSSNLKPRKRPLSTKAWTSTDGKNYPKFYLTGPKNHPGLIELEDKDETPLPPKKLTKSSFGDLLAEAKTGGENIVSPEKKKKDQLKKEEYERTHKSPSPVRLSAQEARWSPEAHTTGLPNLQTLQHIGNALKDGTAFRKGVAYRPESPPLPKSLHFQDYLYPAKPPRRYDNSSQVSFCQHQDLRINWDLLDPENRNGSWQPSMKDYFRSASDHDDHKSCLPPNRQQRIKVLAERIIQKVVDMENGKLTRQDRRHGKEAPPPPPNNRVEREIHIMVSQMGRGKYENVVEKKEAARLAMEISHSKKTTTDVKVSQKEQNKKRPVEPTSDLDGAELAVKRRKLQKSDVKSGEEFIQAMLQRQKDQKRKPIAAPENRFKPTTMHQRDEQKAAIAEKVKRDCAASRPTKEEKKMTVPKQTKPSQKTQKIKEIETDCEEDMEKRPKKVVSKKLVGPSRVKDVGPAKKEQGEQIKQVKTTQTTKTVEKLKVASKATSKATSRASTKTAPKTTSKPEPKSKSREMTAEERALLADINQAEMEAGADSQPSSPAISQNDDGEDEELRNELLSREHAHLVKAGTPTKAPTTVKQPVGKKLADEKEKEELEDSWGDFEAAQAEVQGPQHAKGEDGVGNKTSALESNVQEDTDGELAADAIDAPTVSQRAPKQLEKSLSKKRKAVAVQEAKDEQPKKKARQPKKSAAIIEDSDDDADYALPDASTKLPEAAVRQGWEAEGTALVEEVVVAVHEQEKETVEVDEKESEGTDQAAHQKPVPPSSPSNKRKRSPSNTSQATDDTPLKAEEQQEQGAEQPAKRLKSSPSPTPTPTSSPPPLRISTSCTPPTSTTRRNSPFPESPDDEDANDEEEKLSPLSMPKKMKKVSFESDVTSPVEGKRKMSIPYIVDAEKESDEVVTTGRVDEQEEESEQVVEVGEGGEADEGANDSYNGSVDLDYLFEEE